MGIKPVIFDFNGKLTSHLNPGAFSDSKFISSTGGLSSVNNGIILGDSLGGVPKTIYRFASVGEAEELLKKGSLLDAVRCCFNPGGGFKPQYVMAMSVNAKIRASMTFHDSSSTPKELFRINSKEYGHVGNSIGFFASQNHIALIANNEVIYESDSYKKPSFSIALPSLNTPDDRGTLTIEKDKMTVTSPSFSSQEISFDEYSMVGDLVQVLRDLYSFTVELLGSETDSSFDLDFGSVSFSDVSETVSSNAANLIALLNDSGMVTIEKSADYKNEIPKEIFTMTEVAFLTGGTNGSYGAMQYKEALEVLEGADIQFITTPSTDEAVAYLVKDHCDRMNSRLGKAERQFLLGHAWGELVEEVIKRAFDLGVSCGALLSPGFVDFDPDDVERKRVKNFSSAYFACKEMGRLMAMSVNEPCTKKEISCLGLEKTYRSSELDTLIQSGVWCAEISKKGIIRNVRSVTTNKGSNLMECEFSVVRECLLMQRDLREAIEDSVVGKAATDDMFTNIQIIVNSKLDNYKNTAKLLISYNLDSVIIKVDGDTFDIAWEGCPTLPVNFAFIKNNFRIFKSTGSIGSN